MAQAQGRARSGQDPALDVALAVAPGGDCLADVAMLRAEPTAFGAVASGPTVSDTLASAGPRAIAAIRWAQAEVHRRVWRLAGQTAPDKEGEVVVDIDGELVLAHAEKQDATATWKKTFGLAQSPKEHRRGRKTLIRTDSGGAPEFLNWLTARGRWLSYSVGTVITDATHLFIRFLCGSAKGVVPARNILQALRSIEEILQPHPKFLRICEGFGSNLPKGTLHHR